MVLAEGLRLALHPSCAVWLPNEAALLVADLHFGKAASFRRLGVPVPEASTGGTLNQLRALLDDLPRLPADWQSGQPVRLVVLGDLLHAARGRSAVMLDTVQAALEGMRDHPAVPGLTLHLVRGNHDAAAGDPPGHWGVQLHDEPWCVGPWALCHEPQTVAGAYTLAGHWHPCTVLHGPARQRLRLPCFWLGDPVNRPVGVLPAFGDFTGMHPIDRHPRDRVWAIGGEAVRELPAPGPG
ncbi:ligase-associated DNA damage response endonuclease PdeM [uncultured Hydrogenophaga sp.]|uniref:ligase-associated DNA damage response endonuclease PdeM n=1 Tax=uncultured Hydrogenophaga sp. TaxID=199683 RepID=UPI0037478D03